MFYRLLLSVSTSELDAAPCCLDAAKVTYGGECRDSLVDDVKTLLKIFLVLFSMLPFWIIYFQVSVRQGWGQGQCLYLSTYLSVLDVLEYLVSENVKVLVLVLDQKVLGT